MATWVITGANRGIGLALCRELTRRKDRVIAACRSASADLEAPGVLVEPGVDVASDDAVRDFARRIAGERVDVLVHNAGILTVESVDDLDLDRIRRQIEVNAIGALRVTRALLPSIPPGGKIAIVTSLMGSMGDNGSGGYYGYRMSKAAVNAAGVSLARDLAPRGIAVAILHPGFVRTGMTGMAGNLDPEESARGLIARIDELTLQTTGRFVRATGGALPW